MPRPWVPKVRTARRIAGRLLRAYRDGGVIELAIMEREACIDTITAPFLSSTQRKRMGALWGAHGPTLLSSGWQEPRRDADLDPFLDELVKPEG